MISALIFVAFVALAVCITASEVKQSSEQRAHQMLAKMTQEEKFNMLYGINGRYVGNIQGNERLGIPTITMNDGPQGFRVQPDYGWGSTGVDGDTTAWPSAMTAGATWDRDVLYRWAAAMSTEFKDKGSNVLLGPGLGIARIPTAGRNFEYLCGEDPYFCAKITPDVIKGIQDQGVIANAKHWVNNEIETNRTTMSSMVSERTRQEIYYPPFEAAVNAGVLSFMCSYNQINSVYACQNEVTLSDLKQGMGFKGWVMSDWGATHSLYHAANAGLDQELPFGYYWTNQTLTDAVNNGLIAQEVIDDKVTRILYAMYEIGLFDHAPYGDSQANVTSVAHNSMAREVAAKSTVLLKNDGALPLKAAALANQCIAVFGNEDLVHGCGSGEVAPPYIITPTQGIQFALGENSNVQVFYNDGTDLASAQELAAKCSVAVVVVATSSCEGSDREDLSLGDNNNNLVTTVAAANKQTIVSVRTPGAILLPWKDEVSAVLINWMPGQEAGNALADILFGKVNPSGRLTVTIPNKENEMQMTTTQFPGEGDPIAEAYYLEELQVGYRWYHAHNVKPAYCFGHGLSYTSFQYSTFLVKPGMNGDIVVSVEVKNIGDVDGAEVSQLYLTFPFSAGEPPRQLKGFEKTSIAAGKSAHVQFVLSRRDMSVWSEQVHAWKPVTGTFNVEVGASSCDLRLMGAFVY